MFCDLVDSTGIAARLDAEEWRDLVGAYVDAASTAITEMGSKVAKKLGDGLMALFGHPVAQENDAERAVRASQASRRCSDQRRHLDDVRGAKRVNRGLRVAELCEDLVRVLAEHRCAMSEAARRLGQIHRCRR